MDLQSVNHVMIEEDPLATCWASQRSSTFPLRAFSAGVALDKSENQWFTKCVPVPDIRSCILTLTHPFSVQCVLWSTRLLSQSSWS